MTKKYELVCILDPQVGETQFDPLVEKYENLLKANGVEIVHIDRWGTRKLAFTSVGLKRRQHGHYVLFQLEAPSVAVLAPVEHELKMDESVLRHLVVAVTGEFLRVPQLAPEDVYIFTAPPRRDRRGRDDRRGGRDDRGRRGDRDGGPPRGPRPADRAEGGTPAAAEAPAATETPAATGAPAATETPAATGAPAATETPAATGTPAATEAPAAATESSDKAAGDSAGEE